MDHMSMLTVGIFKEVNLFIISYGPYDMDHSFSKRELKYNHNIRKTDVKECKVITANLTRNLYQLDEMFPIHSVHQIGNLLAEIFVQVASEWIWAYRTFLKNLTFLSKIVPLFQNYF